VHGNVALIKWYQGFSEGGQGKAAAGLVCGCAVEQDLNLITQGIVVLNNDVEEPSRLIRDWTPCDGITYLQRTLEIAEQEQHKDVTAECGIH
jgi:hypothetical protein